MSLERRLRVLRELLSTRGGTLDFDDTFGNEDRLTQAVTLFALLEMHKKGEATWDQGEVFGPIRISSIGERRATSDERRTAATGDTRQ